ncbi:MAG: leucyl aminopeptidase family protein, partial [Rheinheimera sp.]
MAYPTPVAVPSLQSASADWDALICIAENFQQLPDTALTSFVKQQQQFDQRIGRETVTTICPTAPGQRLILAPTGPLLRDFDDVRCIADVAKIAILQAKAAGAVRPLL